MRRTAILLLLALPAAGCATNAFSPHARDNSLSDLRRALAGMSAMNESAPRNVLQRPLAFAVASRPARIIAFDLQANRVIWTASAEVASHIVVGRQRIFHLEGRSTVVARNVENGEKVWTSALRGEERLLGMATDGEDLYYVVERLHSPTGDSRALLVALNGRSGSRKWHGAALVRLGAPAAWGGRVFVPLATQSLAVLDAATGTELARVRSSDEEILWVRPSAAGIFYGGKQSIYRLDEKAVSGARRAASIPAAPLPEAIRLTYGADGYDLAQADYTAYDRNHLLWQLRPGAPRFAGDSLFAHKHRFFFAFDSAQQREGQAVLRWAYAHPRHDVVASTFTGHALVLITDHGEVIVLDPQSGRPVREHQLNATLRGATLDAAGYQLPTGSSGSPNDLHRTLAQMLRDPDRRFSAIKLFCLGELGRLPGSGITQTLLEVLTHDSSDPAVYRRAGEILVARHDQEAIPLYLQLLQSHFSFVEGTRGMAVGVLAQALGSLEATEAIRPLLLHLADHETPLPAVVEIIKAVSTMADGSVLEPFRDFLLTYRCEPSFSEEPAALDLVADALLRLGGNNERQLLTFVANDPHTLQSLRTHLQEALQKKTAPARAASQGK